jgi:murein DD-endopeptidase MepM/ murein hydrolase activator NlpD
VFEFGLLIITLLLVTSVAALFLFHNDGSDNFANQKISLLLFSERRSNTVKQVTCSVFPLLLLTLVIISGLAGLVIHIPDFLTMKTQMPQLSRLKQETGEQKRELVSLIDRINVMTERLNNLQALDQKLKVMVDLEEDDFEAQMLGVGGSEPDLLVIDYPETAEHKELIEKVYLSIEKMEKKIDIGIRDKDTLHRYFSEQQEQLAASTPSVWPVRGWLTSRFGYRVSPFTGRREFHRGLDIAARINTPVTAPADGTVSSVRRDRFSGRVVGINHSYGLDTIYAHLQKVLVKEGQTVKRGEVIALVGNTGRSTGPHLHYEVRLNGIPVDPLRFTPEQQ